MQRGLASTAADPDVRNFGWIACQNASQQERLTEKQREPAKDFACESWTVRPNILL